MSEELILTHAQKSTDDFLIYTGNFCGYCTAAIRLLERKNLTYTEINFDHVKDIRKSIVAATGHRTVPVILDIRQDTPVFVGGFDQLQPYLRKRG
ncbi:MAG: glutaredoxin [Euryarchaeota archaeon]|nr:glutaredoxin [Euryarchaeota archaeon]|tara:strand:+ start:205 stop:489 length:285 start_codon:yes stop_codon:yes gene_type:complete